MARSDLYRPLLFVGLSIAAASVIWAGYTSHSQPAPVDEVQPAAPAISQAIFVEGRLWILHDDGTLASLRPTDAQPDKVKTSGQTVAICRSSGHLMALVAEDKKRWKVQEHTATGWEKIVSIPVRKDSLAAFGCSSDSSRMIVATNHRLLKIEGQNTKAIALKLELKPPFGLGTAFVAGDAIWIGFNVGEWGGGLRRISLSDGTTETIESNHANKPCGGPLNTECDPVNGIAPSLSNPSCIVAAIGLVHMIPHGRIIEVCGKNVRRLYFKPLGPQPPHGEMDEGEPSSTVPFVSLARAGQTIWALGIDGLYRFDGSAVPQFQPLPKFENRGGYSISFDVPGIALVMTGVNQRVSMSGAVPIMAVR